jgi:hypothetical protein
VWYNTTTKSFKVQNAGSVTGGVVECIFRQTADSNAVGNTVTNTIFNQTLTIPANFLTVGKTIRVRYGVAYTTNSVATTAAITQWLNGLAGTSLGGLTTSTFTNPAGRFEYESIITCRSTGAGGTIHVSTRALGNDQAYGYALIGDDVATFPCTEGRPAGSQARRLPRRDNGGAGSRASARNEVGQGVGHPRPARPPLHRPVPLPEEE